MCAVACMPLVALAGCGGAQTVKGARQDSDEPKGNFPVAVEQADFPLRHQLAQDSQMKIVVRNAGDKTIHNIAVTVKCPTTKNGQDGSFDRQIAGQQQADKNRPNFIVNTIPGSQRPATRQDLDPLERSGAYVNTYTMGPLAPNQTATFVWNVTAVHTGTFRVCYQVAAGLDGKSIAVPASGSLPIKKEFDGMISNAAPQTGVAPDGTVTTMPSTEIPAK